MTVLKFPDRAAESGVKIGPNRVDVRIIHGPGRPDEWPEGTIEDLPPSYNITTTANNGGRDMAAAMLAGQAGFGITSTIATNCTATVLTATATPFVASAYIGQIVVAEETTNAPVWGMIISNTNAALTIDGWHYGDGTAGTTPATTCNYNILPGAAPYRYMALTENSGAASAATTTLTGEITTGQCGRALATYAHTLGTGTTTLIKSFAVTATFPAIHKIGLFQSATASGALCGFEVVLNADASVVSGDTLQVTWTLTVS
jgi:hypothetical protein